MEDATLPEISLGSIDSNSFQAPRLEHRPSTASRGTSSEALNTPGPSKVGLDSRLRVKTDANATPMGSRRPSAAGNTDDTDGNDDPPTPVALRSRANGVAKGTTLTLREQEKVIDALKKENFSLKLKVHFLEERLNQLASEQVETVITQNVNLKLELHQKSGDLKKYKKVVVELEKDLQSAQKSAEASKALKNELEETLDEREREIRELRRRRAVGPDDAALREAEMRNTELEQRQADLEDQLEHMKAVMEENLDEIDRLKDELVQKGNVSMTSDGGESRRARLERKLLQAEDELEELRVQHEEDVRVIAQHEEENDMLQDELERIKLEYENLERRREAETMERSESRAMVLEEREEREALQENLNAVRDQLAATTIELQQREDDFELKCREIDEILLLHEQELDEAGVAWRGELEEARGQMDELRDVIAENDAELRELRSQLEEQENLIQQLENEIDLKEEEIIAGNRDIEKLSRQVLEMEDELERIKGDNERISMDRETLGSVANTLKEKLANAKAQLQETTALCDQSREEILAHRARQEELGRHAEALAAELQTEREQREHLENELDTIERHREDDIRRHKRALEDKEAELQSALNDVSRQKALFAEREADLLALQSALKNLEAERKQLGESATNDKFSLELELDRLKRDLSRTEDDLNRARAELADREAQYREKQSQLDKIHAANRDLTAEVATQTQARLNATERLDSAQAGLKTAEADVVTLRSRVNDLEQRLSKDQRSLLANESQFRDQLTERNTLLLTIYQYMEKIIGVDKTSRKPGSETKPFTNFSVFHDNLISKLKALSQIQLEFDKRAKETETRLMEQYNGLKKRLENYSRQIDTFEKSVKAALENKQTWRRKHMAKEGELEAMKTINASLSAQLNSIKVAPTSKDAELRAATAKFANSERRLINFQNQLTKAEESQAQLIEKQQAAEAKWEARVKEYEVRLKAADEKIKREKQGHKEHVATFENAIKGMKEELELKNRQKKQLTDIVEQNNLPLPASCR